MIEERLLTAAINTANKLTTNKKQLKKLGKRNRKKNKAIMTKLY